MLIKLSNIIVVNTEHMILLEGGYGENADEGVLKLIGGQQVSLNKEQYQRLLKLLRYKDIT